MNTPELVRSIREIRPGLPVLHIGEFPIRGMPDDVANLSETFTPDDLLATVAARGGRAVLVPGLTSQAPTRLLNTVLHSRKHSDIT